MEEDGGQVGDASSSLDGDALDCAADDVGVEDLSIQKKGKSLDAEYFELQVQEESLRGILDKLQKDQSCLEAGVLALEEPRTKSHPINKKKRANDDNDDDDHDKQEEAVRRLRQALMEESSCSGSEDDDERVTTGAAGLGASMEV